MKTEQLIGGGGDGTAVVAEVRTPTAEVAHAASMMAPRILIPFLLTTLIWGSTWIVIKDQLGSVPPAWSITYRFLIAAAAMFVYARIVGAPLGIGRRGHLLAIGFGIPQFFLNFNFVYAAEHHVTSGLVAVVFALLVVPNSILAFFFLKHRVSRGFVAGSAVALIGIALLFVQEVRASTAGTEDVLLGMGLTFLGVLAVSVSNTMQASEGLRSRPMASMLAWGMIYGVVANAIVAFATYGAPVGEPRLTYWLGVVYLGLFASAIAFTLHYGIIRAVGPGKAAYSSVLVPIIAMAFSTAFEDYHWSPLAIAGGLLSMAGLFVALRSRKPA